ncbi:hypothetical protein SDC9_07960 [bioreactor metagenome]|uniref:Na+/Pi-cotransporter n=1 Tax=bioreactor metagenome TaxID=1076179 RepID=A0A644T5Z0_9ZZZZ|nr:Na/Pi symporter [Candidatus Elulimicrobiales bacterium]
MSYQGYSLFISIVAIVFLFLFAIQKFSYYAEKTFKDDIKRILHKWTKVPIIGAFVGFVITAVLQSSTAVSVLLVTMTKSKLITLAGALAVLIGANLGTTLTVQLLSFKILDLAPYLIILGFILMRSKNKAKVYGEMVFYFGMIFSCLYLISVITHPMAESETVLQIASLASNIWLGIIIGFVLTNILQSSTLMTSIIVILAAKGILNFDQSFILILGSNLGTTTTALLAATVSSNDGKRIAIAHFLFSFVGIILFLPFIKQFSGFIQSLPFALHTQVAFSHFVFNFVIAVLALIFFKYYYKLLFLFVPARRNKKKLGII